MPISLGITLHNKKIKIVGKILQKLFKSKMSPLSLSLSPQAIHPRLECMER
jgi:hypothetical protein